MKTRQLGWRCLCGGLLVATSLTVQANVILAGKEWLQPADFTNLSWNDIAAVCAPDTGACNGTLNGTSLTGWTWAAVQDVGALFAAVGIPGFTEPFYPSTTEEINPLWAQVFIDTSHPYDASNGFFSPTGQDLTSYYVQAITRTLDPSQEAAYTPIVAGALIFEPPAEEEIIVAIASTAFKEFTLTNNVDVGLWVFRVRHVPEPGTLTLLGLGLAGLGVVSRRRRV